MQAQEDALTLTLTPVTRALTLIPEYLSYAPDVSTPACICEPLCPGLNPSPDPNTTLTLLHSEATPSLPRLRLQAVRMCGVYVHGEAQGHAEGNGRVITASAGHRWTFAVVRYMYVGVASLLLGLVTRWCQ